MSSFTAAAVDDWSVRPDPLSDSVNGVSQMIVRDRGRPLGLLVEEGRELAGSVRPELLGALSWFCHICHGLLRF
jgi:hypothetical protein